MNSRTKIYKVGNSFIVKVIDANVAMRLDPSSVSNSSTGIAMYNALKNEYTKILINNTNPHDIKNKIINNTEVVEVI